jgi:uncharacterized protein
MDRSVVELSTAECWERLAEGTLGRLALSIHALPIILLVRYVVDDRSVAISIDRLGMPDDAVRDSVVALAADDIRGMADEGWSVQVQGIARLTALGGGPGHEHSNRVVRLEPGTVTGLRYSVRPLLSAP